MTYEEFLVARREAGATVDSELERVSQLSKVAKEVKANHQLSAWLERHAGAINVITDKDDAVAEVIRLKASAEVIGIDIETAKASDYTEHLQAGLHPKVSRIRLVQLFQDTGNGVTIIDCFGHMLPTMRSSRVPIFGIITRWNWVLTARCLLVESFMEISRNSLNLRRSIWI